jgi:hypothetical protein
MRLFLFLLSLIAPVCGDVYLHNPRGNNNRCDERNNNRNNANRLFDSQNNAAGGYAVACDRQDIDCYSMNYYGGSLLPIRWTSQHNCGENNDCQFIIQYACEGQLGQNVRNGYPQDTNGNTCTQRIPEQPDSQITNAESYGKNEDYAYYQRCKDRERNYGLFTADQRLRGTTAIYTRQNPNGNRYGFECPEERDYYPYWGESDWRDIAVLTTNTSRCDYYYNESRCNREKHDCVGAGLASTNQSVCETHGGIWVTYPSFNDCNMTCEEAPTSRINRLGIAQNSSKHTEFVWRLPNQNLSNCVLRLRYNISTRETPWEYSALNNSQLENNPVLNTSEGVPVRLAINTAQYGRTFEDRSYTFNIIERPQEYSGGEIYNVNVQGKRGNIAQVRNCIEYDFVPDELNISTDDFIHFQFIGSDYNPQGNDGEGRAGTDRSNLVLLDDFKENVPGSESNSLFSHELLRELATIGQDINNATQCFTFEELSTGNQRNNQQDLRNCALLNRANPYFNLPPKKMNRTGKAKLMSSRNNNFSNRGQKFKLSVYQNVVNITNTTDNNLQTSSSNSASSTSDNDSLPIVGIVISVLVAVGCIGVLIFNRKDVNNYFAKKRKSLKLSMSSRI